MAASAAPQGEGIDLSTGSLYNGIVPGDRESVATTATIAADYDRRRLAEDGQGTCPSDYRAVGKHQLDIIQELARASGHHFCEHGNAMP